jgi:hypothetical protein
MGNLNTSLSLLASKGVSEPWNSFLIIEVPYLPLRDSGFYFLASTGSYKPIIYFQRAMGSLIITIN